MRMKFDAKHIESLCEPGDYGIFPPPMKAQTALNELCHYFLGIDWYDSSGCTNTEQINTIIVCEIEKKYSGAVIKNKEDYFKYIGRPTLSSVPIGTIFQIGNLYFCKITDTIITDKISLHKPNIINLLNGHEGTINTNLYINPVESIQVPIKGLKIKFSELNIGDKFRWNNIWGVKIGNSTTPNPNFINLITNNPTTIDIDWEVLKLK